MTWILCPASSVLGLHCRLIIEFLYYLVYAVCPSTVLCSSDELQQCGLNRVFLNVLLLTHNSTHLHDIYTNCAVFSIETQRQVDNRRDIAVSDV